MKRLILIALLTTPALANTDDIKITVGNGPLPVTNGICQGDGPCPPTGSLGQGADVATVKDGLFKCYHAEGGVRCDPYTAPVATPQAAVDCSAVHNDPQNIHHAACVELYNKHKYSMSQLQYHGWMIGCMAEKDKETGK